MGNSIEDAYEKSEQAKKSKMADKDAYQFTRESKRLKLRIDRVARGLTKEQAEQLHADALESYEEGRKKYEHAEDWGMRALERMAFPLSAPRPYNFLARCLTTHYAKKAANHMREKNAEKANHEKP